MRHEWEFPEKLEFLFEPHRYKIAHGGRGGAKSWGFARALLIQGWQERHRVGCFREVQKSIKDSVHKLLSDQIEVMGLSHHYTVLKSEIRGANGTEFLFAGLSDLTADSLKSFEGLTRAWVEEGHAVTRRSWDKLIPTIRAPGSEIWISLNPELATDETYVRFVKHPPPDAKVVQINWRDNPWFPDVLEKERQEFLRMVSVGLRTQDEYDNIWEGLPLSTVPGAIYPNEVRQLEKDNRIRLVPIDPLLKVHTVWDLGWNDQTSIILVQRLGSEVRIVDYIEDTHRTLADYFADLKERRLNWGTDFLPHDGDAKNLQTGKSAREILQALGRTVQVLPNMDVESGIKATRLLFPRCYFDADRTQRLIECLRRYRRQINQTTNEPMGPLHDEFSHGADAFRYLALAVDMMSNDDKLKPIKLDTRGIV